MMQSLWRAMDANVNRVSEGFRVLEDVCRFLLNKPECALQIRQLRHRVRGCFSFYDDKLMSYRDVLGDDNRSVSITQGGSRQEVVTLVKANAKRVQEGLRVLAELCSLNEMENRRHMLESLRFEAYNIEKLLVCELHPSLREGLYAIITEKYCQGRDLLRVARDLCANGVVALQYREKSKDKSFRQMLSECQQLRTITTDFSVQFIVNDFAGLADAVNADGVHIGQDDLPIKLIRRGFGNKIIGISTHDSTQARQAVTDGADYLGVGPVFSTQTKDDVCSPVGLSYVEFAAKNIHIPWVAIGGIKKENLAAIIERGASRVCMVTGLLEAPDIANAVRDICSQLDKNRTQNPNNLALRSTENDILSHPEAVGGSRSPHFAHADGSGYGVHR